MRRETTKSRRGCFYDDGIGNGLIRDFDARSTRTTPVP